MKHVKIDVEMRIRIYLLTVLMLSFVYYFLCVFVNNDLFQAAMFFDIDDTFMDWFNCLVNFKGNPYEGGRTCNYPAAAVLLFKLCRFGIPEDMLERGAYALRNFQSPWIVFMLYNGILVWIFVISVSHKLKLKPWDRNLFFLVFLFSFPVMFALERGNIINLAFALTVFFYSYYEDENKVLKELAFLALALAAAIKIYPAIFGLLLLKQKRIRECIRLAFYGVVSFVCPFWGFGGWRAIEAFVKGLLSFSTNRATVIKEVSDAIVACAYGGAEKLGVFLNLDVAPTTTTMPMDYGYNFSFRNISNIFQEFFGLDMPARAISAALTVISIVLLMTAFQTQERWKEMLSYTLLLILIPSFSSAYATIFLFIPFMEFLNKKTDNKNQSIWAGMDYMYALVMLLLMTPWALPDIKYFSRDIQPGPLTGSLLLYFGCVLAFTVLMLFEGMDCLVTKYRRVRAGDKR